MTPLVVGIAGSARRGGNSDRLLAAALAGARAAGAETEILVPAELAFLHCLACEKCRETGRCVLRDGAEEVYRVLLSCQGLVVATPVYFGGLPAPFKALVDRAQFLYFRRYELRDRGLPRGRPALLLLVAAGEEEGQFELLRGQLSPWLSTVGFVPRGVLTVGGVDRPGEVSERAIARARRLGETLL
ncbi:flavodoxin family protein [Candidatus Bipolaricaulota bacterium]|nr:flavodoxin family protein [Candidatus Bipolaricaulota bacterium]